MNEFIKKYPKTAIFLAYLILTLVLTYPVVFKITKEIPAEGGDAFQILRRFNLIENKIYHFLEPEKYPLRMAGETDFENQTMRNFFLWLSMPFPLIFGETLGYNILWLLSFAFSGWGAYLLIDFLAGDRRSALLGGFIYAFSPLHFAHAAGHFYAMHIEWIPFYFLFLFKFIKTPSIKNGGLTLLFFILIGITDAQYLILSAVLTLLFVIYYLIRKPRLILNKKLIAIGIVTTIISSAILYLQYGAYIKIAGSEENFLKPNFDQVKNYSADFFSILVPSRMHPIWGEFFYQHGSRHFTGNLIENTLFSGWLVALLALYGFIYAAKEKNVFFIFWGIIFVIFFLVALGPFLSVIGYSPEFKFPLPYLLFYKIIPFFDHSRTVSRNFIIGFLALVILASYGLKNFPKPLIKKDLFFKIFSVIIFIEFLSLPYKTAATKIPEIYQKIAGDKENYKVLELPTSLNQDAYSKALYFETIHKKEIVGGLPLARKGEKSFDFEERTPIIRELLSDKINKTLSEADVFDQNYKKIGDSVLNYYNIRYILLQKKYLSAKDTKRYSEFIEENFSVQKEESDKIIAFKVAQKEPSQIFLKKGGGFSKNELSDNEIRGVIKEGKAEIIIENPSGAKGSNFFFRLKPEKEGSIKILQKENILLDAKISSRDSWFSLTVNLEKNENRIIIQFEPPDQKVLLWDIKINRGEF